MRICQGYFYILSLFVIREVEVIFAVHDLQNNMIYTGHVGNRISEVSVFLFGSACLAV